MSDSIQNRPDPDPEDDRPRRPRRRRPRDEDDYEDDYDDRIRRKDQTEATDFLIPTNVSPWSIGTCYFGLIGMCLPFVGLLFAGLGLLFGILALNSRKKRSRSATYGSVTSDIRMIIGLVTSSIGLLLWGGILLYLAING